MDACSGTVPMEGASADAVEIRSDDSFEKVCNQNNDVSSFEETFQGPYKWRTRLRHVPSKRLKKNRQLERSDAFTPSDERNKNRTVQPDHFETQSEDDLSKHEPDDSSKHEPVIVHRERLTMSSTDVQRDSEMCYQDSSGHIPHWKRDFMDKSTARKMFKPPSHVLGPGGQASQIPVTVRRTRSLHATTESAFTRQVVNSNQNNSSVPRKKLSPSNSFRQSNQNSAHPGRRIATSANALNDVSTNTDLTKKRIERVQRARLYLLQQTGPNSFLIGGDSPDHKFKVIIGPQTCSCGRNPHCVHVLFVMLRVFQVGENDPCLWSRTLKNYEVENLFRIYHDKRSSRIARRRVSQRRKLAVKQEGDAESIEEERNTDALDSSRIPSESDTGSTREEEDTCPICLLEMLEGESLIKCESGCHNRLHHHCIAIWFEECRRQNDPLNCPLCRASWKTSTVEIKSTQNNPSDGPEVPPNTRASSPQPSVISGTDNSRLPHAEPISPEMEETAAPWVQALGPDLVSCLLSRNWSIREAGLKHLNKEVMATLLKGAGEGRQGAIVSPVRRAATQNMLHTACNILAYTCADPVYRVFVASLRSLRTMLSYTPCRDSDQRTRLQATLKPVVEAIILKCTDGNRRTSQLSLSTLVELVKGQEGELAVGRELLNPGTGGIDGLNYVLQCVTEDYNIESVPWQWLLGRLYVIDRLLEEFPTDFLPRPQDGCVDEAAAAADEEPLQEEGAAAGPDRSSKFSNPTKYETESGTSNYERLMSVAHFSVKAVCSAHMRIARMSRRVFLLSAKFGAHVQQVIAELKDLLGQIDSQSVASLGRKLDRIVEDFQLSERIVHELMHGSGKKGKFDSAYNTPVDSPISSPRCNSPVTATTTTGTTSYDEGGGTYSVSEKSVPYPSVPPNTPIPRAKRKLRRAIPRRSFRDSSQPEAPPPTQANSPEKNNSAVAKENEHHKENIPAGDLNSEVISRDSPVLPFSNRLGSSSPPNRRKSNLPLRRKTIERDNVSSTNNKRGGSSSPTIRRRTHDGSSFKPSKSNPPSHPSSPQIARKSPLTNSAQNSGTKVCPKMLGAVVPIISVTDTSVQMPKQRSEKHNEQHLQPQTTGAFQPVLLSDLDESCRESADEVEDSNHKNVDLYQAIKSVCTTSTQADEPHGFREHEERSDPQSFPSVKSKKSKSSSTSTPPAQTSSTCSCRCHHSQVSHNVNDDSMCSPTPSGTAGVPNTPESAENSHFHTAEHESMSSDDFLDFTTKATPPNNEKPVSFKSEVAESPKSSPSHSVHSRASSKSDEGGNCKEEVEREEAEALAKALEVSERQNPVPVVPGLTPTAREEVITIRIQPDNETEETEEESKQPVNYLERIHWRKGPLLGTGAYSTCYQARDVSTGVIMAVKQISFCRNSPQEQEKVVEAISEEIHMMAKLNHPNIVRILGATKQGCHFNMFVEWMPGGSVSFLLGEYGVFTDNVIVNYTRQILRGLAYLHDNHILHRDLKGANLLVDSTGQALRIGDFGASARLASQATGAGEFQGQLLGTIAFMAPEVLRGESYGRACDIWSVGCVMVEMATTKPPWNATDISNHLALIFKIASSVDSPPIPEHLAPPIRDLMLRCLEQKSEDRPSAKDLLVHPLFTQCFPYSGSRGRTISTEV